ncbi:hypothetical protein OAT84_01330 [Gammaproteobacteria bacterium]|nr:hypothetical protein [Gammaproteobacteria bacterium]
MSSTLYISRLIDHLLEDMDQSSAQDDVFSNFQKQSQLKYEKRIKDQLKHWQRYFSSPKPRDIPWIEQLFAVQPILARNLVMSLHGLVIERHKVNCEVRFLLSQKAENTEIADAESHLDARVTAVHESLNEIEHCIQASLKEASFTGNAMGYDTGSLINSMNAHSQKLFKNKPNPALTTYHLIAVISVIFLLCATSFMTYLYFATANVLVVSFIESMVFAFLSTIVLAANTYILLKGVYRRRQSNQSMLKLSLPSGNDTEFEEIDLDTDKAHRRTHRFETVRTLLQDIYADTQSPSHYTRHSYDKKDQISQSIQLHIQKNEGTLSHQIKKLYEHFQSQSEMKVSWLDHLFEIKPKLADKLIDNLYHLSLYRRQANLKIHTLLLSDQYGQDDHMQTISTYLNKRDMPAANLERFIDAFNKSVANLSKLCSDIKPSTDDLYEHMSHHFAHVVKKKGHYDLRRHAVIQGICIFLILSTTGCMSYFYLYNQKIFMRYFIAVASITLVSIAALCIDSYCLSRLVKKSDQLIRNERAFVVPSSLSRAGTYDSSQSSNILGTFM